MEEQGEGRPALQDIIDGLGEIVAPGELGAPLTHVNLKLLDQGLAPLLANRPALLGTLAVDRPLDLEQGVDAAYDLNRDRREHTPGFARGTPTRVLLDVGHGEERTPGV